MIHKEPLDKAQKHQQKKIKQAQKKRRAQYRQWHRRIGTFIVAIILLLAISGIALNHTGALQLGKRYISSAWLLDHYQITAPEVVTKFDSNHPELVVLDNQIWLANQFIHDVEGDVLLAVKQAQEVLVVSTNAITRYRDDGEMLDNHEVGFDLEHTLSEAVYQQQQLVVKDINGWWAFNDGFLEQSEQPKLPQTVTRLNAPYTNDYKDRYRSRFISYERLMQDVHSGRFFGPIGIWVVDLSALALIFLSLSGWILSRKHKH